MLSFQNTKSLILPDGFALDWKETPSPQSLNRLLSRCNQETHPPKKLTLALKKSLYNLSIIENSSSRLFGFVRITSDKGLNANLWDLAAEPGENQDQFLMVLVNYSLGLIRREMPGCSVSVAAPQIAIDSLEQQGFLIDPSGIRTMAYRIN